MGTSSFRRTDLQVKIRGYRIELREIELALERHPAMRQAVVLAREERLGEKLLVAYLVLRNDERDGLSAIKDDLRSKLPEYMVPSDWVPIEEVPLTTSGKVDRKSLASRSVHSAAGGRTLSRERDLERVSRALWGESLHLDQVGIHDNLFELGGHSLMTVELSSKIEASWGSPFHSSLSSALLRFAELAEVLGPAVCRAGGFDSHAAVIFRSRAPLFCMPGLGGDAVGLRDLAEHLGEDRSIYGLQPSKIGEIEGARGSMQSIASLHIDLLRLRPAKGDLLPGWLFSRRDRRLRDGATASGGG